MYIKISEFVHHMYPGEYIDTDTGNYYQLRENADPDGSMIIDNEDIQNSFLSLPEKPDANTVLLSFLEASTTLNKYSNNRSISNLIKYHKAKPNPHEFWHDLNEAEIDRFGSDHMYANLHEIWEEFRQYDADYTRNTAIEWCEENNLKYSAKP